MIRMRQVTAGVLIAAFLSVAVFGFVAMGHGEGHSRKVCVAAASQAAPCPEDGPVAWAFFHASAFKGFSSALVSAFLVLAALVAFAGSSISVAASADVSRAGSALRAAFDSIAVSGKRMAAWLAILEKRDPAALPRVRVCGWSVGIG